jgi:hypothetical protein
MQKMIFVLSDKQTPRQTPFAEYTYIFTNALIVFRSIPDDCGNFKTYELLLVLLYDGDRVLLPLANVYRVVLNAEHVPGHVSSDLKKGKKLLINVDKWNMYFDCIQGAFCVLSRFITHNVI